MYYIYHIYYPYAMLNSDTLSYIYSSIQALSLRPRVSEELAYQYHAYCNTPLWHHHGRTVSLLGESHAVLRPHPAHADP